MQLLVSVVPLENGNFTWCGILNDELEIYIGDTIYFSSVGKAEIHAANIAEKYGWTPKFKE